MSGKPNALSWTALERMALVYLGLPVLLFLLFWFKTPYNILFAVLAGCGIWQAMRPPARQAGLGAMSARHSEFGYSGREIFGIWALAGLMAFVMGVGGWMQQSADYEQANEFFRGMTPAHWPWECQFADGKQISIVYYFGYHLLPGLFGSLGGRMAIDISSLILSALGIGLGLLALGKYFRLPAWTLVLLFGFSGLSFVGDLFWGKVGGDNMFFTWWAHPWRNISPVGTLFFAAHHFITPLILTPLLLRAAELRRFDRAAVWVALGLFWSPLATVGAGALILWPMLRWGLRGLLRWGTLALLLGVAFPVLVFYSTRLYPDKLIFLGGDVFSLGWKYPCFVLLEFGLWFALVKAGFWRDAKTWLLLLFFLAASFFTMGQSLDLFYRLDQAWQLVLFALVIRSLLESSGILRITVFTLVYLLGAVAPACFLYPKISGERVPLTRECRYDPGDYLLSCSRIAQQFWGDPDKNAISKLLLRRATATTQLPKSSDEAQIGVFMDERISMIVSSGKKVDKDLRLFPELGMVSRQAWDIPLTARMTLINRGETESVRLSFRMDNLCSKEIPVEITRYWVAEGRPIRPLYTAIEMLEYRKSHPLEKVLPGADSVKVCGKSSLVLPRGGLDLTLEMQLPKGVSKIEISSQRDFLVRGDEVQPQFRVSRLSCHKPNAVDKKIPLREEGDCKRIKL